ncbi:hypothetical protein NMG60_11001653 [Bertholletia excelsa]
MLLGFISLLLTVFQGSIVKICVNENMTHHLLPCKLPSKSSGEGEYSSNSSETISHYGRWLAEESSEKGNCALK